MGVFMSNSNEEDLIKGRKEFTGDSNGAKNQEAWKTKLVHRINQNHAVQQLSILSWDTLLCASVSPWLMHLPAP
jgi:hypothetical protein